MPPIYTPFIMAENAVLKFTQSNELIVTDENGVVVAGITGNGDVKIWAGGTIPSNANFTISEDGTVIGNGYKFLSEGSGELANGNISWTNDGSLDITGKFETNSQGNRIIINPSTSKPSLSLKDANNKDNVIIRYETLSGGQSAPSIFLSGMGWANSPAEGLAWLTSLGAVITQTYPGGGTAVSAKFHTEGISLYKRNSAGQITASIDITVHNDQLIIDTKGLPKSRPSSANAGRIWNDGGTLRVG